MLICAVFFISITTQFYNDITVNAAVNSIPKNNNQRVTIYIKNGTYKEKVRVTQNLVALKGQSENGVVITYDDHVNVNEDSKYNAETPTVIVSGSNFLFWKSYFWKYCRSNRESKCYTNYFR